MPEQKTSPAAGPPGGPDIAETAQLVGQGAIARVATLADQVGRMMAVATALLDQGRRVDLAGLEDRVGTLCAQALDLPPAQGRLLRPRLQALWTACSRLENALCPPDS